MKNTLSVFEKILIGIIVFSFCGVVLVQIFINNDVLETVKSNETGVPVSFEESSVYVHEGSLSFGFSSDKPVDVLINGEKVRNESKNQKTLNIIVKDGDVIEVRNDNGDVVTLHLLDATDNIAHPKKGSKYSCKEGLNYLFKVEIKEVS